MSLGIVDKSEEIKDLLTVFSKSDFKHDFSINKSNVIKAIKESIPLGIGKVTYLKKANDLDTQIENKSIYEFLKDDYSLLLPYKNDVKSESEDELLVKYLNINYNTWRRELIEFLPNLREKKVFPKKEVVINKAGINRNYNVQFVPTKVNGTHFNLPNTFKSVCNQKNKFVVIIDASFFSMSGIGLEEHLRNCYVGKYNPDETYEFYILENNENSSDSANKTVRYDVENKNIKLYILREPVNTTVNYPAFDSKVQESNLFSNIDIISKKVSNGKINATLRIDSKEYEREDLGNTSQIERASFLALQKYVLNDFTTNKEVMSYFLLKRAGDWCQALSLLDYSRVYDIYSYVDNKLEKTDRTETLNSLQKDSIIGLVTHDRILLAYCLLLGINVFYSLKTVAVSNDDTDKNSVTWLAYFQNTVFETYVDDIDDIKKSENEVLRELENYKDNYEKIKKQIFTLIKSIELKSNKTIVKNVVTLRHYTNLLHSLFTKEMFDLKLVELNKYYNEIRDITISEENKKETSIILSCIRSLIRSLNEMNTHNIKLQTLKGYETQLVEEKIISDYIEIVQEKNILDEKTNYIYFIVNKFKEDYLELKEKNLHEPIKNLVLSYKKNESNRRRVDLIYGRIILEIVKVVDEQLEGGSIVDTLEHIKCYINPNLIKMSKYINDENGNFYSNISNYIVMNHNIDILKNGLLELNNKTISEFNQSETEFYKRFIIFYLDELYTKLFTLEGRVQYDNTHRVAQFEDDLFLEYLHVYFELELIRTIFLKNQTTKDVYKLYFEDRFKWTSFFLLGESTKLSRFKNKDITHFNLIVERLYNLHETVRSVVLKEKRKRNNNNSTNKTQKIKKYKTSTTKRRYGKTTHKFKN